MMQFVVFFEELELANKIFKCLKFKNASQSFLHALTTENNEQAQSLMIEALTSFINY